MSAIKLNQESLDHLAGDVSVPRYDRAKITPGIMHIGVATSIEPTRRST